MKISVQQYLTANQFYASCRQKLAKEDYKKEGGRDCNESDSLDIELLEKLRALAQEEY
jgi:hypothetical protein